MHLTVKWMRVYTLSVINYQFNQCFNVNVDVDQVTLHHRSYKVIFIDYEC